LLTLPAETFSPGVACTLQVTAVFVVLETEAMNLALKPAFTVTVAGDKLIATGCVVTVIVADADCVSSAVEVAVTLTVVDDPEIWAGATNRPVESMPPALAVQVTGDVLLAVNCWRSLTGIVAEVGKTVTDTVEAVTALRAAA
jgi:hypothetical protein